MHRKGPSGGSIALERRKIDFRVGTSLSRPEEGQRTKQERGTALDCVDGLDQEQAHSRLYFLCQAKPKIDIS